MHPVRKRAARCLVETKTEAFTRPCAGIPVGCIVNRHIAAPNIFFELREPGRQLVDHHLGLDSAGCDASQRREQCRGVNFQLGKRAVNQWLDVGFPLRISQQHARQWTNLYGIPIVAWRLQPAIFSAGVEKLVWWLRACVIGLRLTFPGMQAYTVTFIVRVPGMRDVFSHLLLVNRLDGREVLSQDQPTREEEGISYVLYIACIVPIGHIVAQSCTLPCPVLVEGGDGEYIGQIDLRNEVLPALEQLRKQGESIRIDGGLVVKIE